MGIGEKEEALRWRERAYEEQSAWMVYLNIDPRLDGLHSARRASHAPPAEIAGNLLRQVQWGSTVMEMVRTVCLDSAGVH
jgi:hypothetical protein